MQLKSARGVQQADVWAAADALIAEGLRPTIERVRLKIGRGSPNTVSPLLEAWFATLASRLGVNNPQNDATHIPKALQQAMENLWTMALSSGREKADQQIVQAQFDLSEARQALHVREGELVQQKQVLAARYEALEEALRVAENKADDLMSRLNHVQALTSKREGEIEVLRGKLAVMENERDADRRRIDEDAARYAKERQRYEERAEATQHKLLEDIDKARQETKKMRIDAQLSEKQLKAECSFLQQKIRSNENFLSNAQELASAQAADLSTLRESLAVSNLHSVELRNLLEKHQIRSETTIARLTEALSAHTGRQLTGTRILVRKIKRPIRIRQL